MEPIEVIKTRYRIEDAWKDEGFEGLPSRCGKSPFRDDHKPSFSVFADGTAWKDHATGESGDVFTFLQLAHKCSFEEALALVRSRVVRPTTDRSRIASKQKVKKAPSTRNKEADTPRAMPPAVEQLWNEGIEHLSKRPQDCEQIDKWRGYPIGTTNMLSESQLISCPVVHGKRGIAFAVHAPAASGLIQTGFHFRVKATGKWQFLPNISQHGQSTHPIPFILGHGHLPNAQTIIITEGCWDAIAWAAWAGWLKHDAAWPTGIIVMGILGATNWRFALEHFTWPQTAHVLLIPDNDEAGNKWKEGFLKRLQLHSHLVTVMQPEENDLSDQLNASNDPKQTILNILESIAA